MEPTVWIIDDNEKLLQSLKIHIDNWGFTPKTFNSAETFLKSIQVNSRGCIILDITLPGISGLDLQTYLKDHNINIPIIFITGYGDVSKCRQALKEGAFDFIEKPFLVKDLKSLVERALLNQEKLDYNNNWSQQLTKREKEVYKLLSVGDLNKEVAYKLGISLPTVKLHRKNMMNKLNLQNYRDFLIFVEHNSKK